MCPEDVKSPPDQQVRARKRKKQPQTICPARMRPPRLLLFQNPASWVVGRANLVEPHRPDFGNLHLDLNPDVRVIGFLIAAFIVMVAMFTAASAWQAARLASNSVFVPLAEMVGVAPGPAKVRAGVFCNTNSPCVKAKSLNHPRGRDSKRGRSRTRARQRSPCHTRAAFAQSGCCLVDGSGLNGRDPARR